VRDGRAEDPQRRVPDELVEVAAVALDLPLRGSWNGTRMRRTSSGSARSERAVKPARSQNKIATERRSSTGRATDASATGAHRRQNRARSGSRSPQEVQDVTPECRRRSSWRDTPTREN